MADLINTLFGGSSDTPYSLLNVGAGLNAQPPDLAIQNPNGGSGPVPMPKGETLGKIGDFLSWVTGGKQQYKESVRRAEASNALDGFTQDPLAAIQKLSRVDPGAAIDLYNTYSKNQANVDYRAAIDSDRDASREALIEDKKARRNQKTETIIGGMLNTATPQNWPALRPRLQRYAEANDYDLAPLDLPDNYDETAIGALRGFGSSAYQRDSITARERGQDVSTANNIRSTNTSASNNARSTSTSARNTDVREGGQNSRQQVGEAGKNARKGPLGADFKKFDYRQKPDGTWQRKPKG